MISKKKFEPSLLTSFSLLGALITMIIAIVIASILEFRLEQNALHQEAESAADQVSLILNPNLIFADFSAPLDAARYDQIDEFIRKDILRKHIIRVKIWSSDGRVIYSDDKDLVGRYFPMTSELEDALNGNIAAEISELNESENVNERNLYDRLMEVYMPIQLASSQEIVGAYEIYHDLIILDPVLTETRHLVWISVGLAFLVLYGSLFLLVRNASRELIRRNNENKLLFEQEQSQKADLASLYDLSRSLADAYDFEKIFSLVTQRAVETVRVTYSCMVFLENNEFIIRATYPVRIIENNFIVGEQLPICSDQFCQRIMDQKTPEVLSVDAPDLPGDLRDFLLQGMTKTMCLIPLHAGERAFGLLMLGESRDHVREPFSQDKIRLARSIGDQAASALSRIELFIQLEKSYLETVLALANAVDAKDTYTGDHAQHLSEMALVIGREMGMSELELVSLRYGAILHDIGKIGVPDFILNKPARLDPSEWEQMRKHPFIGARILEPVPQLAGAALIVHHHHERFDGKGYPDGLAGEAIPLGARILTVVDSYSAITDRRVYKEARSHEEAVAELITHAEAQFDPRVVEVFLSIYNEQGKIP